MPGPLPRDAMQAKLMFGPVSRIEVPGFSPLYSTQLGDAYQADSLALMKALPDESVNVVLTSPPYALHFKKEYGNADKKSYVEWFLPFAREIFRILKPDGSFILNIGGSYNKGEPTRSLYHFKLLVELVEIGGVSSGSGVLLVQPREDADAGRVGYGSANPGARLGGVRVVAVQDAVAEGE